MKQEKMAKCGCSTTGGENLIVSTGLMMDYAKKNLTPERAAALRRAHRIQLASQIAMPVLILIGAFVYHSVKDMSWGEMLPATVMILLTASVVWSFLATTSIGRLWTRYTLWYKAGRKPEKLDAVFTGP